MCEVCLIDVIYSGILASTYYYLTVTENLLIKLWFVLTNLAACHEMSADLAKKKVN